MHSKKRTSHKKRIGQRLLALFMMAIMVITVMPENAMAYIGAIRTITNSTAEEKLRSGYFTYKGAQYIYVENDYLHFDVCFTGDGNRNCKTCHTIPTAMINYDKDGNPTNLDEFGQQELIYQINENGRGWRNLKNYNAHWRNLNSGDDILAGRTISITPYMEDENYNIKTYFTIVRVDKGTETESNFPKHKAWDPDDYTSNWAVQTKSVFWESPKNDYIENAMIEGPCDQYRMTIEYPDFSKMGHKDVDPAAPTVSAQWYDGHYYGLYDSRNRRTYTSIINGGLNTTGFDQIVEVYSDSYSFAAPFVAASTNYHYYSDASGFNGVEGHEVGTYPSYIKYQNRVLTAYGHCFNNGINESVSEVSSEGLWGFRNLYSKKQMEQMSLDATEAEMIKADNITVGGKGYLYVRKDGKNYKVYETDNESKIQQDAVAIYHGDYEKDTQGIYHFKGGAVKLSSTMTLSWDKTQEGMRDSKKIDVCLKPDGTWEFPGNKVQLQTPSFKCYIPKDDAEADSFKFAGYNLKDTEKGTVANGVVFTIDPEKNDAIVNGGIPGYGIEVNQAALAKSGELVFSGSLGINLFLANVDMQRLSYGQNGKNFSINGLEASGMVKAPSRPPGMKETEGFSIFGLGGSEINADISTFKDNERYNFDLTISVQNMFETNARLDMVRLQNGSLCPDNLSFAINVTNDAAGIMITPSTPVVKLTGGGGGVYNIASQVQGSYVSIPPVVVKINATGKCLEVIEGNLCLYVGPSKLSLQGEDVGFKLPNTNTKIKIIKNLGAGFTLNDKTVNKDGVSYQGYEFAGEMGMDIALIPKDDKLDDFEKLFVEAIRGHMNLRGNVVVAENQPINKAYSEIGLVGTAGVLFRVPIIKTDIAGAQLDACIKGTNVTTRNANPLQGMTIQGGIGVTGQCWLGYGRAIYILPDKYKLKADFGSAPEYDWEKILSEAGESLESQYGMEIIGEPEIVTLEDGSQMAAVVATNIRSLESETVEETLDAQTGATTATVMVDKTDIPDGQGTMIMLTPDDEDQIDDLMNSVSVNNIPSWTKITPKLQTFKDDDGKDVEAVTNSTEITTWIGSGLAADKNMQDVVYVGILKDQIPADGKIELSASESFTAKALSTAPVTGLEGKVTAQTSVSANTVSGNSVSENNISDATFTATIDHPVKDHKYTLMTYYGEKDEDGRVQQQYILDSRSIKNSDTVTIQLPESSDDKVVPSPESLTSGIAPTGRYFVSAVLVDEQGLPIETFADEVNAIKYLNKTVPKAPEKVTLEKLGNEDLKGTWSEVIGTKSLPVDGYKLTIYQEDENGDYVDTGRGYDYTVDQLDMIKNGQQPIEGLTYDADKKEYSINMAMTVGGDAKKEDADPGLDDQQGTDGNNAAGQYEEDANLKGLETNKNYKLGVSAYTMKSVTGGETTQMPAYSSETVSAEEKLEAYEPLTYKIYYMGYEVQKNAERGMYETTISKGNSLQFDDFNKARDDVKLTVTAIDLEGDAGKPVEATKNGTDGFYCYLPDFEGSAQFRVDAAYSHDGVEDTSTEYISVAIDNVAPDVILDMDGDILYADKNNNYVITGSTEPGAEVSVVDTGNHVKSTIAGEDGSFTIRGQASSYDYEGMKTEMLTLTAEDDAGNESEEIVLPLSKGVAKQLEVTQKGCEYGKMLPAYSVTDAKGNAFDASGAVITYEGIQRDGTDYSSTVAPTKAGSYKVTVFKETDEWDYLGTSELFEITPADISKATVTLANTLTYNGKTQEQGVSKVMVGKDVVLEAEYTVSENSALDAGEYTMRLIAKDTGNYTGEAKKAFTIAKKKITPVVTIDKDSFDYTGSEIKPVVTVKEGATALPAKDYVVVYADNKEAGTGKVTVKEAAGGNYTFADVTKTFTIKGEDKPTVTEKVANPMTVKAKTVKLKLKEAKKKAKIKATKSMTVKNAKGKVTYKLISVKNKKFAKSFKLNSKTGLITLKKKLKAGTYRLKIKVTAAGNDEYMKAEKTVTVKVKVAKK